MDVGVATALVGAALGPAAARGAYQLSVDRGTPARHRCSHCGERLPPGWFRFPLWTGRCGYCRESLGPKVWQATIACAAAGFAVGHRLGSDPAVPVFLVKANGEVVLFTAGEAPAPQAGDLLISLVDTAPEPAVQEAAVAPTP